MASATSSNAGLPLPSAPNSIAAARPILDDAPVIIATLPCNMPMLDLLEREPRHTELLGWRDHPILAAQSTLPVQPNTEMVPNEQFQLCKMAASLVGHLAGAIPA
jgi:hypothetical protein